MASFPTSQYTSSRGFDYSYIHTPPTIAEKSYILFLHGFPSSSKDWEQQVQYFAQQGYGILAPDLLGFGGTSRPLDMNAYKGKAMAKDLIEILDHENIQKVIGVAHDWGSYLLSRLANLYATRFSRYVFLDVGYSAPGNSLTKDVVRYVNAEVEKTLGYSIFGYFLFFDEEGAAELMDKNIESVRTICFTNSEPIGKQYLGAEGGMRTWLTEGKTCETVPGAASETELKELFSKEKGGFGPSINWYRAQLQNINADDDKEIPKEAYILAAPTLLVPGSKSFITAAADFPTQMKPFTVNLRVESLDCSHWIQREKPVELNRLLEEFFAS